MTLKYQLTAEEFAQLDEAKQALYVLQGEVYQLQVDGIPQEDVSGLKRQRDELLAEKKAMPAAGRVRAHQTADRLLPLIRFQNYAVRRHAQICVHFCSSSRR